MSMYARKRNSPAFPVPMPEMGQAPDRDAPPNGYKKRKSIVLPRGESTVRPCKMDTRPSYSKSNDQVCNSHGTTRARKWTEQPTAVAKICTNPH